MHAIVRTAPPKRTAIHAATRLTIGNTANASGALQHANILAIYDAYGGPLIIPPDDKKQQLATA